MPFPPPSATLRPEPDSRILRALMQNAGLRFTLARLKVLAVLYVAIAEVGVPDASISGLELHKRLVTAGEPLSLVSVRDVLRRMEKKGIVQVVGQDRFCSVPVALALLHQEHDSAGAVEGGSTHELV